MTIALWAHIRQGRSADPVRVNPAGGTSPTRSLVNFRKSNPPDFLLHAEAPIAVCSNPLLLTPMAQQGN
jgi:hypothetical protein